MRSKTTIQDKAIDYHLKGLNCHEIGKLLNLNHRTVQRYIKATEHTETAFTNPLKQLAIIMHSRGYSYADIAKKLNRSKTTIYLWNKEAKNQPQQNTSQND